MSEEDEERNTIEIKARKYLYGADGHKIIDKGTVKGVVTSGKISGPIKKKFDESNIAWAEDVVEEEWEEE